MNQPSLLFSVIIPTHNHGRLIQFPIRSLQRQNFKDFEILIVGDGVSRENAKFIEKLAAEGQNIRFFDMPKGERHGERSRHEVITKHAKGKYITYVGDDDVVLPNYLEQAYFNIQINDFISSFFIEVRADETVYTYPGQLSHPFWLDLERRDFNNRRSQGRYHYSSIGLTGVTHSIEVYNKLPTGWSPAPIDMPTDLFMWQKILNVPGIKAHTITEFTFLKFPSPSRKDWTIEQREEELFNWEKLLQQPNFEEIINKKLVEFYKNSYLDVMQAYMWTEGELNKHASALKSLSNALSPYLNELKN